MKRNVFTIFLASPGDLIDERNIVRHTVQRINKVLSRRIGWHIELLGWEDTLPGFSRPQEIINKDVDICNLFIGVLWKRWGQSTGKYSSGFFEEFTRACERCRKTSEPEIWLYFKSISDDFKKDPGEQLCKVLEFKEKQKEKKELYYKVFKDTEEWEKIIYDEILAYLIDISKEEENLSKKSHELISGSSQETENDSSIELSQSYIKYPAQIEKLFNKINEDIKKGLSIKLDVWEKTRLLLQTYSWYSSSHSGEYFGTHEANLAYRMRKNWVLSEDEEWFLLRSIIDDNNDVIPGYYWFYTKDKSYIDSSLSWLTLNDNDKNIKGKAISLLADTGYQANEEFIIDCLKSEDTLIINKSIDLILNNEKRNELLYLLEDNIECDDTNVKIKVVQSKVEIIYENSPDEAFKLLLNTSIELPSFFNQLLEDGKVKVSPDLIIDSLNCGVPSVRRFSSKYLQKNNLLTKEICRQLLKDTDSHIRKVGIIGLIDLGEPVEIDFIRKLFPDPKTDDTYLSRLSSHFEVKADHLIPIVLSKRDPIQLLKSLDFYNTNNEVIYRVLAEDHFEIIKDRIRSDLDDEFESHRAESEMRLKEKYETPAIINIKPNLIEFIKHRHIAAALSGLALYGDKNDIKYGRKFLGKTQYNLADPEAMKIIRKFGDSSDVKNLIDVSEKIYSEDRVFAIESAIILSKRKSELIKKLLDKDDATITTIVVKNIIVLSEPKIIEIARSLLLSEHKNNRLKGLSILINKFSDKELEKLLDEYYNNKFYYYNVITWLDRYLYSPTRYKKYFKEHIQNF